MKIVYVGDFQFPDGDAASARVLGIGKALRASGYEVVFAGSGRSGRPQDLQADGSFAYQSFPYFPQAEGRPQSSNLLRRAAVYLGGGRRTVEFLETLDSRGIAAVFVYQSYATTMMRVHRFCARRGIPVVADVTEWHTPAQLPNGRFGLPYWDSEFRLRVLIPRYIKHVVCISSYLGAYFRGKGCHTIEVPPLIDLAEDKWHTTRAPSDSTQPLALIYAGTPGKKDLIGNVVRAVCALRRRGRQVVLHCAGPTAGDIAAIDAGAGALVADNPDAFVFHGRVPQQSVPALLGKADFSVFVRPRARYAQAGFPTKLVESLAASVPVITNDTGDIGRFVSDGCEGIVLADPSVQTVVDGIERLFAEGRQRWSGMGALAQGRAMRSFDYQAHSQRIREFTYEVRTGIAVCVGQSPGPTGVPRVCSGHQRPARQP